MTIMIIIGWVAEMISCRMIRKYQEVYSHMLKNQVEVGNSIDGS